MPDYLGARSDTVVDDGVPDYLGTDWAGSEIHEPPAGDIDIPSMPPGRGGQMLYPSDLKTEIQMQNEVAEVGAVQKELADEALAAVMERQGDLMVGRKPGETWSDYLDRAKGSNIWLRMWDDAFGDEGPVRMRPKLATEEEILRIEKVYPDVARPLRQQRRSFAENAVEGVKAVGFAIPAAFFAGLRGIRDITERVGSELYESAYTDQPVKEGLKEAIAPTLDFGEEFAGSVAESGVEFLRDPGGQVLRDIAEAGGNASMLAGGYSKVAGKFADGARRVGMTGTSKVFGREALAAARVAEQMEPVAIAGKAVRSGARALANMPQGPITRAARDLTTGLLQGGADAPPGLKEKFANIPSDAAKMVHERGGALADIPNKESLNIYKAATGDTGVAGLEGLRLRLVRDLWSLDGDKRAANRLIEQVKRNPTKFDEILRAIDLDAHQFGDEISAMKDQKTRLRDQMEASFFDKKKDIDTPAERTQFKKSLKHSIEKVNQWDAELSKKIGAAWEEVKQHISTLEPHHIDMLRRAALGKADSLAVEIVERQAAKKFRFVAGDGTRLDDLELLGPKGRRLTKEQVDDLGIELSTGAPQSVWDHAHKIKQFRKEAMELEEIAHATETGGGGRLLAQETIDVRRPTYMADLWEPSPFAGFDRGYGKLPGSPSKRGFVRSYMKDKLTAIKKSRNKRWLTGQNVSRAAEIDLTKKALTIKYYQAFHSVKKSADQVPWVKSQAAVDDLGWQYNNKGTRWWAKDPKTGHHWIRDQRKGPAGYAIGAAADVWVRDDAYKVLRAHAKSTSELGRAFKDLFTGLRVSKVIGSSPAHVMQIYDNTLGKWMVDGTGVLDPYPSFNASARAMGRKEGALFETMRANGIIHDFAEIPMVSASLNEVYSAPGVARFAKATHMFRRIMTEAVPMKQALAAWVASDSYGKTALVYRWAQREAWKRTMKTGVKATVDDILAETAKGGPLGEEARLFVDKLYPDYRNLPDLVTVADKTFMLPFVRYSTWSYGRIIDASIGNGFIARPMTEGMRSYYDTMPLEEREIVDVSPEWTRHYVLPIGGEDERGRPQYINLLRWSPFAATPEDAFRLHRGGMFGADLYSQRVALETSGALDFVNTVLKGSTSEFKKPLTESQKGFLVTATRDAFNIDPDSLGDQVVSLGDYVVKFLLPSTLYAIDEKVLPAAAGRQGSRGRELSLRQALLSLAGLKIEPSDMPRMKAWINRSYKFALGTMRSRRKDELNRIDAMATRQKWSLEKTNAERKKWTDWYSNGKKRLIARRNELISAKY